MEILTGICLFLMVVLLWFCFVIGNKADVYKKKYNDLVKRFELQTKKYNTLTLWYEAYKEAADVDNIEGKH